MSAMKTLNAEATAATPTKGLFVVMAILLLLPWLFPFATGPAPAVQPWLFSLACFGLVLGLGRFGLRRDHWGLLLAWSILAAALISTGIGLIQYFGFEKPFSPWLASSFKGESFANLRQKNQFASLAVMGLLACAYFCARPSSIRAFKSVWFWGGLAFALGMGNAIAASRTGVAELALAVVVVALWAWRSGLAQRLVAVLVANGMGFAVASAVLPLLRAGGATILERATMGAEGCHSRLILWQNVWQLSLERPWTGWGWGSLKEAHYMGVFDSRFCEILDNAHNLPLHVAVELGLLASALMCIGIFWFLWRTWPATFAVNHGFDATHLACGILGVVLVHSMLEYPLWYGPFQISTLLCVWLLWTARKGASMSNIQSNPRLVAGFIGLVATVLISISGYASWDYWRVSQIFTEPEHRADAYRDDTLNKISGSLLFAAQVAFADLAINPLTADNAGERMDLALRMLSHSPEPRVIEAVLLGAATLGRADWVALHRARYAAAFPDEFAAWAKGAGSLSTPPK